MEWLRRNAAPLSQKVWKEVDDIAGSMFKQTVGARRIADFDGPRGWNHVATQLGTFKPAQAPQSSGKVRFSVPDVLLLTELYSSVLGRRSNRMPSKKRREKRLWPKTR